MHARLFVALSATVLAAVVVQAQQIRIGTIAPRNSTYTKALEEMGAAWKTRTSGRVGAVVHAGTVGTEETILRSMRGSARSLQAAQLSAISLGHLDPAFNVFGLPMFFESYEEADRALATLTPTLEERLERQQLKALNFAFAGWVHVFSREPIRTVSDLKRQPLYTSSGDDAMAKWYRSNGFTPVQLDPTQMLESLQTGGIRAAPAPPIFAQMLNWYSAAPHMMEVGFAPLLGATVMSLNAWNRIAQGDQAIVLEEARKAGERLRQDVPRIEREAIAEMQKRRLTVTPVDRAEWRQLAEQLARAMLAAKLVPEDVYDIARRERDAVRGGG